MSSVKDTSGNNKKNRRAYLDDFQKDETGDYVYRGAVYDFEGSAHSLRSLKISLCALNALMLAALLLAGLIRVPGMDHCIYVLLPYAAALCGSVSVGWALGRLCIGGVSLRAYLYQESIEKLPVRCIFTACCSFGALLGELVYILITDTGIGDSGCLLFLIHQGIAIASALLVRSRILQTKWHKHDKTAAKSDTLPE